MQDAQRAAGHTAGYFTRTALLASSFLVLASSFASAQILDPLRGYSFDGSPVGPQRAAPRGRDYPVREDGGERQQRQGAAMVSMGRVRRIAAQEGYRLAGAPHRHGHSIVALAENDSGHRFELVFNAYNGAIVEQRDLGAIAAAKAPDAAPQPENAQVAASPAPPAENDELTAARADLEKAATAEAEARRTVEARAADTRKAQARLAEAVNTSRRAAEAKLKETRHQEAMAAEQKRNEARAAEAKRQALAAAEAKLAQAKASQARAEAEAKRAEAEAEKARAAAAPAELAKVPEKPAEMAPVAGKDTPAPDTTAHATETAPAIDKAPEAAHAVTEATSPSPATTASGDAKPTAAPADVAIQKPDGSDAPVIVRSEASPSTPPPAIDVPKQANGDPEAPKQATEGTDPSPTGSTKQTQAPAAGPTPAKETP